MCTHHMNLLVCICKPFNVRIQRLLANIRPCTCITWIICMHEPCAWRHDIPRIEELTKAHSRSLIVCGTIVIISYLKIIPSVLGWHLTVVSAALLLPTRQQPAVPCHNNGLDYNINKKSIETRIGSWWMVTIVLVKKYRLLYQGAGLYAIYTTESQRPEAV